MPREPVVFHPPSAISGSEDPLRVLLDGRRLIRKGGRWRVFADGNQTHNHRLVSPTDHAYLEWRFPA
jgi:hypothetical protein